MMRVAGFQNKLFEVDYQNCDYRSEPNEALFSGKNLKSLIMAKHYFQRYIICLCLVSFAESCIFREKL